MARPRDPSVEPRIVAAAQELLSEGGYDALTMEAVANRAGVGKPTVYRRWSTRAQLVFELLTNAGVPDPVPDTGSFERDLCESARWLARSMAAADRKIMGDRLGEMIANGAFAQRVWEQRLLPDREVVMAIWHRAVERGEVRRDIDGGEVLDDLVGALAYRILVRHQDTDDRHVDELVGRVLAGVLTDTARRARAADQVDDQSVGCGNTS
jgi:AcrR family transcriptional regulator